MVVRQLCGCGEGCGVVVGHATGGFVVGVWETANPKNVSTTTTTQLTLTVGGFGLVYFYPQLIQPASHSPCVYVCALVRVCLRVRCLSVCPTAALTRRAASIAQSTRLLLSSDLVAYCGSLVA